MGPMAYVCILRIGEIIVKAHQAHVTDGKVVDTVHAADGKVADTVGDKAAGKRPIV